jgi:hypothetical protein
MSHENKLSVTRRRLLKLLVLLAGICVLVGLVGIVVGWVGTYIVPVVVAFVVLVVSLGLLAWAILTLYNDGNKIS